MRTTLYIRPDDLATDENGKALAQSLGLQIRSFCTGVSGPHKLENSWDINCRFGKTEFWISLKRSARRWEIVVDSVWDMRSLVSKGLKNPDQLALEHQLADWLMRLQDLGYTSKTI